MSEYNLTKAGILLVLPQLLISCSLLRKNNMAHGFSPGSKLDMVANPYYCKVDNRYLLVLQRSFYVLPQPGQSYDTTIICFDEVRESSGASCEFRTGAKVRYVPGGQEFMPAVVSFARLEEASFEAGRVDDHVTARYDSEITDVYRMSNERYNYWLHFSVEAKEDRTKVKAIAEVVYSALAEAKVAGSAEIMQCLATFLDISRSEHSESELLEWTN